MSIAASTEPLRGVLAAALTPMRADGAVDAVALVRHTRWLLGAGCDGVVILGTTGEANSMTVEERLELLDELEGADGIPPGRLIIGTGCCALADTARLTGRAVQLGAAGALVLPPFYYKGPAVSDEGLLTYFGRLIDAVADERLRVYLYHFPQLTGITLGLPLLERLCAAWPCVVGLKDSSGDWAGMAAALDALPGFQLFAGTERLLLPTLERGGAGCISATVNVLAPRVAAILAAWRRGEAAEAARLQEQVAALRALLQPYPLVAALKAVMRRWSGDGCWGNLRPPLSPLPEDQAASLVDRLRAAGLPGADIPGGLA